MEKRKKSRKGTAMNCVPLQVVEKVFSTTCESKWNQDSALIRNIHFLQKWVFALQGGQKPDFRGRKWIAEAAFSRSSATYTPPPAE